MVITHAELVDRLAALVAGRSRVALNGPDAAGKTTLADQLAERVPVRRLSIDDFHRPPAERLRRGSLSPEGYLADCFDFPAFRQRALELTPPLLAEGVFLLVPELRDCWDLTIYLDVSPEETLRRALERDVAVFGSAERVRERYTHRYLPGQRLYRDAVRPVHTADVVIGYDNPGNPVIRRWPAA